MCMVINDINFSQNDFIKIDVEEMEIKILKVIGMKLSIDWKQLTTKFILVSESTISACPKRPLLYLMIYHWSRKSKIYKSVVTTLVTEHLKMILFIKHKIYRSHF